MCNWIPFLTTLAILVNSISLVCIALDRYMAVVNVVMKSSWEPTLIYCLLGTLCVWVCGAGIASPMLAAYATRDITVAETDPNNRTVGIRKYGAQICICDKVEIYLNVIKRHNIIISSYFSPKTLPTTPSSFPACSCQW